MFKPQFIHKPTGNQKAKSAIAEPEPLSDTQVAQRVVWRGRVREIQRIIPGAIILNHHFNTVFMGPKPHPNRAITEPGMAPLNCVLANFQKRMAEPDNLLMTQ